MALSLSREFSLAAACAVWPSSDRRQEAIRTAAVDELDWGRFLRVVTRHRVVGLAHEGLKSACVTVPSNIAQELSARAVELVRQNLALAAEAVRLQRLFAEADLPVLFVKGASLAMLAYGNLGLRESKDLDLFVGAESLSAATALIERAGYRRFDPPLGISDAQMQLLLPMRKDFGYLHEASQTEIELHWRLLSNPYFMDDATVMTLSRIVPLRGTNGLRSLGEDDLFSYLCAHGAQHWWYQLKWLADIGALLGASAQDDAGRLYRAAEARGVGKAAAQAILLCQQILGTAVPDELVATLHKRASVRWLETTALRAVTAGNGELEPRQLLFGTTRGSLSSFLLGRGWRYWLAELKSHLICQADVFTVALPRQLQFLYPLLRLPLWLLRHGHLRRDQERTVSVHSGSPR